MRPGTAGFWIGCRCCGEQFESKGLAYCGKCRELPAEERHAVPAATTAARTCAACGKPIPYRRRAGTLYCSPACNQAAARDRRRLDAIGVTDNGT
jgi:hypothetical protein